MRVSYNWLQTYFAKPLPQPEEVAQLLTFHTAEIESIEKVGSDTVLDVKILPDRAHYLLSYKGIAEELSVITKTPLKNNRESNVVSVMLEKKPTIIVMESTLCRRYVARMVENISVGSSPEWIRTFLQSMGQRSINTIVDATNVIMFDSGQPLHAFDADVVVGDIHVRMAKEGETITTLDGKEVSLSSKILVIADSEGPLAIAGVKGGIKAQVTSKTKRIIIESANFDPTMVRRVSTGLGIRTESSKRFENEISPEYASVGMNDVSALIAKLSPEAIFGPISDIYEHKLPQTIIQFNPDELEKGLGFPIDLSEAKNILERMGITIAQTSEYWKLTIPYSRLDLKISEDIVEEVGRIYGYDKIPARLPPQRSSQVNGNRMYYYTEKIKDSLVSLGFSEVYTYSLVDTGEIEIQNPLASDKKYIRTTLWLGIEKSLLLNTRNADLLALPDIKLFEIGTVFGKKGEHLSLAIGVAKGRGSSKETQLVQTALEALHTAFGVNLSKKGKIKNNIFEINLSEIITELPEPTEWSIESLQGKNKLYHPISPYPFIVRDIAVFVPTLVTENEITKIIDALAGPLMIRRDMFDVFTKKFPDGNEKTSYAFRIVFQSPERTLTDQEVNMVMEKITKELNTQPSWQVR